MSNEPNATLSSEQDYCEEWHACPENKVTGTIPDQRKCDLDQSASVQKSHIIVQLW